MHSSLALLALGLLLSGPARAAPAAGSVLVARTGYHPSSPGDPALNPSSPAPHKAPATANAPVTDPRQHSTSHKPPAPKPKPAPAPGHSKGASKLEPGSAAAAAAVGYDYMAVVEQGVAIAAHSWEYGAVTEALLEVYNPELSVFGASGTAFPGGALPLVDASKVRALAYAQPNIQLGNTTLSPGAGASGDPASLGVAAYLIGQTQGPFLTAAQRQVDHLWNVVPRYSNGAISQREDVAELWADFMFMAPPTLAYGAVAGGNTSAMQLTVDQCGDYRDVLVLQDGPAAGLWQHIVGPQSQTLGVWSTGNAWAALGMLRVLATMSHWERTAGWLAQGLQLKGYLHEIFDGVLAACEQQGALDASNGLLRNYIVGGAKGWNDTSVQWFGEASGTAGLAAGMYRLAVLDRLAGARYLAWADAARKAIAPTVTAANATIAPTVNPLDWYDTKPFYGGSPEGQAFVAMLGAAYVDCVNAGVCEMDQ